MEYIKVPNSNIKLYDGSIVMLTRFPDTRWIVHNGWYTYSGTNANGWFFKSLPAGTVIPMNVEDLKGIILVSDPTPPEGYKPNCPVPPFPPGPPVPPFPPGPPVPPVPPKPEKSKSVREYVTGTFYKEGQIVYIHPGELYQCDNDFKSSYSEASVSENLAKDVEKGYLKKIPSEVQMHELEGEVDAAVKRADEGKVYTFYLNFSEVFGTDTPSKTDADNYLEGLASEVTPHMGVYFKNSDQNSPTYKHIFTYYPNPNLPGRLIFIDDTVDGGTAVIYWEDIDSDE